MDWLPLEDIRGLWYWGPWKEPVPSDLSTSVVVVCTSRKKCLTYAGVQTHDHWLLPEDVDGDEGAPAPTPETRRREYFDEGQEDGERRFRRVAFDEFLHALGEELQRAGHWGLTLLINPRRSPTRELVADAMWAADEFLAAASTRERGDEPGRPTPQP